LVPPSHPAAAAARRFSPFASLSREVPKWSQNLISDQCEEGEGSWLDPWIPAKNLESSRVEEVEEKGGVEKKAGRA